MQRGGTAFAKFILVGVGGGGHIGAVHADGQVYRGGTATLRVGDGDGIELRFNQRYGLRGLAVGVDYHVGRLPVVGEGALRTRVDGDGRGFGILHGSRVGSANRGGRGVHGDVLHYGACAGAAATLDREGHTEVASRGVSVGSGFACAVGGVVAEVPSIAGDLIARGGAGELRGFALAHGGGGEAGVGSRDHGDGLGHFVGTAVAGLHGVGHVIGAWRGISVVHGFTCTSSAVVEVPSVIGEVLAGDGGSASELGGVALAYGGCGEAGFREGKDKDRGRGTVGLVAHGDGAGVCASHGQGAVGDGGVLLRGAEVVGTRPLICGARLSHCREVYGLTHAVRAVVVDQRRQDAAVGGAGANVREVDVAGLVGIVGDEQDVVITVLGVVDVAVLGGVGAIATVRHGAARQLVAGRVDVVERSPAVEVDIHGRGAVHVDVQVAWLVDSHVVEGGVGCR